MQITTPPTFLPAAPSRMGKAFWGRWFERSLRANFHECLVKGAEHVLPWAADAQGRTTTPLILYGTHGSWWDAAVSIVLSLRVLRLDAYGMMEHRQLDRYRFFRSIGMFSVVREDTRSALHSLEYGATQLRGTARSLWMFPQGTLVQQDVRPIVCEPGIGILARKLGDVMLCPVAFRYEILREQRPACRVIIGTPHAAANDGRPDVRDVTEACARRLTALADEARADAMLERTEGYQVVLRGKRSMEKRFDAVMGRNA